MLRCGLHESGITLRLLAHVLVGKAFTAAPARAALAVHVQELRKDGLVRAHHFQIGDKEFDEATRAMIGERSVAALLAAHARHKARRTARAEIAACTLAMAAELSPVFGLLGTLISLGRLPGNGLDRGGYFAAIAMAVHATMIGLVAANLLFAPLARLVERRLAAEEGARQELFEWLALQLAASEPHLPESPRLRPVEEHRAPAMHWFRA